jgi:hypothetical protein
VIAVETVTRPETLRPMTIAEIFDRAVTLTVRRWQPAFWLTVLALTPDLIQRAASHGRTLAGRELWAGLAIGIVFGAFAWPALIRLFAEPERGSAAELLRRSLPDVGRVLATSLLIWTLVFVPLIVLVIGWGIAYGLWRVPGGIIAAVVVGAPLLVVAPAAFCVLCIITPILILERSGPWESVRTAVRRARRGGFARASLLGAAILAAVLIPVQLLDGGLAQLAHLPGWWWIPIPGVVLEGMIGTAFGSAVVTVVAIDYRVRAQGTDLHAALDLPAPSTA